MMALIDHRPEQIMFLVWDRSQTCRSNGYYNPITFQLKDSRTYPPIAFTISQDGKHVQNHKKG